MRDRLSSSSLVQLEAIILAQLRTRPQTARDIERATASAHSVIARRLLRMGEAGSIHVRVNPFNVKGRPPRVWFIGAGPESAPDPADQPQQILTKTAPAGVQRDTFVAAFFGPGNRDPICTYCGQPQGLAHAPGCAVARFV